MISFPVIRETEKPSKHVSEFLKKKMKYLNTPAPPRTSCAWLYRRPFLIFVPLLLAQSVSSLGRSRSNPSFQEFCLRFLVFFYFPGCISSWAHIFHFFVYISNKRRARWWHISIPLHWPVCFSLSSSWFLPLRAFSWDLEEVHPGDNHIDVADRRVLVLSTALAQFVVVVGMWPIAWDGKIDY